MKEIVVILGHPVDSRVGRSLAEEYRKGAEAQGSRVEVLDLASLVFDLDLVGGLHGSTPLEPDLVRAQASIRRADHLVFVYPNWWGTFPARLKGFLDRTLLPGFAFAYRERSPFPQPLLTGKTARLITTMDGPGWWFRWAMGGGGDRAMVRSTLAFCGIRTVGIYRADRLRPRAAAPVDRHRSKVSRLGQLDG